MSAGLPRSKQEALGKAIERQAKNRADELLAGVGRYLLAPYARRMTEPPTVWRRGNARLLDYGPSGVKGPVVLFVPSLINRYYILDLEPKRSLLRYLAENGVRPLVLDWGEPGPYEKGFACEEYIRRILLPALTFLHGATRQKIALAGYCMGGVLALAAAQLGRRHVASLALLATPWNFHCQEFAPFLLDSKWHDSLSQLIGKQALLHAGIVQTLFYAADPWVFERKFRRFAGLHRRSQESHDFIALERWVNDGVALTSEIAAECLIDWAQKNCLAHRRWRIGGKIIDPAALKIPVFLALPKQDHIVPPGCAFPLARLIRHAVRVYPSPGHVGMVVGRKAKSELWRPLLTWLADSR